MPDVNGPDDIVLDPKPKPKPIPVGNGTTVTPPATAGAGSSSQIPRSDIDSALEGATDDERAALENLFEETNTVAEENESREDVGHAGDQAEEALPDDHEVSEPPDPEEERKRHDLFEQIRITYTVDELKAIADELGLDRKGVTREADLIDLVCAADWTPPEPSEDDDHEALYKRIARQYKVADLRKIAKAWGLDLRARVPEREVIPALCDAGWRPGAEDLDV